MKKNIFYITILILLLSVQAAYAGRVGYVSTRPATAVESTPEDNLFSVNGSGLKFILLDKDDEGFFCTTKEFYGTYPFDPNGTGKFDIEDENNIAYWLNNVFPEKGGSIWNDNKRDDKFEFPDIVEDYIIEHDWLCEAGHASTDYSEDYIVRSKFSLMSVTEWKKYNDKIGYGDNTDVAYYYWLRSVNGTIEPGDAAPVMVVSSGGTAQFGKVRNGYGVRPVFYLSREFFTDVKLDVTILGDSVKKILRENFTEEELKKVYNREELESIYKKLPPQAKAVAVSGVSQTGSVLNGTYTYYSPEGEAEFESEYRWLRATNKNGPYSVIVGENSQEFKIRDIDAGYYFVFEVIPKSADNIGTAARSAATGKPADADILCSARNVSIDGEAKTGERLIARYNYYDENKDVEDGTLIKWQVSEDGNEFSDIPGALGLNYIIPAEFSGKFIRFTINVKSLGSDVFGETVISDSIGPIKAEAVENNVKVISDNGTLRIISQVEAGKDVPIWSAYSKEGTLVNVEVGENEYHIKGNEAFVRAGILRKNNGISEMIFNSEKISILENKSEILNDNVSITSDKTLYLKSTGTECAHSVEIELECNGVKIEKAESDYYDFHIKEDGNVRIILIGKENSQIYIPENVLKLSVSGKGTIRIIKTKGVYEFDNKVISNAPDIFFD